MPICVKIQYIQALDELWFYCLLYYLVHLLQGLLHRQDDGLDSGLWFNKSLKLIDCNILTVRLMNTAGCVYGCIFTLQVITCVCVCEALLDRKVYTLT